MMQTAKVIEGKDYNDVLYQERQGHMKLFQEKDFVCIDKQQAAQLIEVLQKWLAGEEVE